MENDSKKNLKAKIEKLNKNLDDIISLIEEDDIEKVLLMLGEINNQKDILDGVLISDSNDTTILENENEEETIDEEVVLYEETIKIGDAEVIEINMDVYGEK